jgi:hypothetical protein
VGRSGTMDIKAWSYRQFDADFSLDVPAEGYGGWRQTPVELSSSHTALVLMHAWDTGTREEYPGWHRAVEYMPRARRIADEILPGLLDSVRQAGMTLFHVVGGRSHYYRDLPGYQRATLLAGPEPPPLEQITADPSLTHLRALRHEEVFVGEHNKADVDRGFERLDFMPTARPQGQEGVAENSRQLFALCREAGINHLVYAGFAINWCLLLSPGGMAEMSRYGIMCSALRQAVTAVENRETARGEIAKEVGLWRVALAYGFVFDVEDFVAALVD